MQIHFGGYLIFSRNKTIQRLQSRRYQVSVISSPRLRKICHEASPLKSSNEFHYYDPVQKDQIWNISFEHMAFKTQDPSNRFT